MNEDDIDVVVFARLLGDLPEFLPITDELFPVSPRVWYETQREHMVGWFRGQATKGAGAYSRQVPNRSAKTAYNRLQCPAALIWMAEALGEDETFLRSVAEESLTVARRSRSAFIRKKVPWSRIMELAAPLLESRRRNPMYDWVRGVGW